LGGGVGSNALGAVTGEERKGDAHMYYLQENRCSVGPVETRAIIERLAYGTIGPGMAAGAAVVLRRIWPCLGPAF